MIAMVALAAELVILLAEGFVAHYQVDTWRMPQSKHDKGQDYARTGSLHVHRYGCGCMPNLSNSFSTVQYQRSVALHG